MVVLKVRKARRAMLCAVVAATLIGPVSPAAQAADLPAYGVITVTDPGNGLGPRMHDTYDPVIWDCVNSSNWDGFVATFAQMKCTPNPQLATFNCPRMVLTTSTAGIVAAAGGKVECNGTFAGRLDTGVVRGVDTATRSGDLGHVTAIVCKAYADPAEIYLRPPYTITCNEPGLPTLAELPTILR